METKQARPFLAPSKAPPTCNVPPASAVSASSTASAALAGRARAAAASPWSPARRASASRGCSTSSAPARRRRAARRRCRDAAPPYQPIVEIVEQAVRALDAARRGAAERGREVLEALRGRRRRRGARQRRRPRGSSGALALFEQVASFLVDVARPRPLVHPGPRSPPRRRRDARPGGAPGADPHRRARARGPRGAAASGCAGLLVDHLARPRRRVARRRGARAAASSARSTPTACARSCSRPRWWRSSPRRPAAGRARSRRCSRRGRPDADELFRAPLDAALARRRARCSPRWRCSARPAGLDELRRVAGVADELLAPRGGRAGRRRASSASWWSTASCGSAFLRSRRRGGHRAPTLRRAACAAALHAAVGRRPGAHERRRRAGGRGRRRRAPPARRRRRRRGRRRARRRRAARDHLRLRPRDRSLPPRLRRSPTRDEVRAPLEARLCELERLVGDYAAALENAERLRRRKPDAAAHPPHRAAARAARRARPRRCGALDARRARWPTRRRSRRGAPGCARPRAEACFLAGRHAEAKAECAAALGARRRRRRGRRSAPAGAEHARQGAPGRGQLPRRRRHLRRQPARGARRSAAPSRSAARSTTSASRSCASATRGEAQRALPGGAQGRRGRGRSPQPRLLPAEPGRARALEQRLRDGAQLLPRRGQRLQEDRAAGAPGLAGARSRVGLSRPQRDRSRAGDGRRWPSGWRRRKARTPAAVAIDREHARRPHPRAARRSRRARGAASRRRARRAAAAEDHERDVEAVLAPRARIDLERGDVVERRGRALGARGDAGLAGHARPHAARCRASSRSRRGEALSARRVLLEAAELFHRLGDLEGEWRAHLVLGRAAAARDDQPEAERRYRAAQGHRRRACASASPTSIATAHGSDPLRRALERALGLPRVVPLAPRGRDWRRAAGRRSRNRQRAIRGWSGSNARLQQVFSLLDKLAPHDSLVLIRGESGTGKELIADALHASSPRRDRALVKVNCGALVETLLLVRAVRPRARRLHRRAAAQEGALRGGRRRHHLPRRDRRHLAQDAGGAACACCRSASSSASAATRRSRSTCASCAPPTATSSRWWRAASSARISTTA